MTADRPEGDELPVLAPAGWYPTDAGSRWWDGSSWGPLAPGAAPSDEVAQGKTLSIIAHLGIFAAYFVLPLVIRLTEGKKNAFVRHHSTEALNFMITIGVLYVIWFPVWVVTLATADTGRDADTPVVGLILFAAIGVMMLIAVVLCIVGAVRASQGVWWRYPVNIRFVRGARSRAEIRNYDADRQVANR